MPILRLTGGLALALLVLAGIVAAHENHAAKGPAAAVDEPHSPADEIPTTYQPIRLLDAGDAKAGSTALRKIREAKARGLDYPGMLWHAVEEEYLQRRARAKAALGGLAKAGGSDSSSATVIDTTLFVDDDTTVGKGNDVALGSCNSSGDDTAEDAWYQLALPTPSRLTAWTSCAQANGLPGYDTRLAVLDENLSLLACNDDSPLCSYPDYQSRIEDLLLDAGTYYVVVDGYNGNAGPYRLNVQWSEEPAVCFGSDAETATAIDVLPFSHSGDNSAGCDDVLVDCELQTDASGPDDWYRLDLDTSVLLDVSTVCGEDALDTRLAVLDANLSVLYCNDDDPLCRFHQSRIEDAHLDPGIYYVVVDSPADQKGPYTVEVDTTHAPPGPAVDLLPDIVVVRDDLYDNEIDTTIEPGRVHLRLSNATANLGQGKLYLYGVAPEEPTPTHEVRQRVWRDDGTWFDRSAGQFVYHPGHNHIHIEGWAQYNLREILPEDGVGELLASGTKTSFCIIDLRVEDSTLPGFVEGGEFQGCSSTIQGLSVGWADIYSKSLVDQWIDVTDVPDGEYWLESVVDPQDHVLESDESNNVARIKVTIGAPAPINPDPYEPNVDLSEVESRPVGGYNSPNLGPCAPTATLDSLTIHESGNEDLFRFYLPAVGAPGDFVRIDFLHAQGDLDLELLDAGGTALELSNGVDDQEVLSLENRPSGWYLVRVFGWSGATSPAYSLNIDPSANGAPEVTVTDPPAGDVSLLQAVENYTVTWTATDPEENELWASVWVNENPQLDGNEFFLETSLNTPGELGAYVISTTYLPLGQYHVYVELTDGGTTTGDWSEGTFTLVAQPTAAPVVHRTRLLPPTPNPFNPSTLLRLELAHEADLRWRVYDQRGARVRTLVEGRLAAGEHQKRWDGTDDSGRVVSSGVYYAVVRGDGVDLTRKLVLLK